MHAVRNINDHLPQYRYRAAQGKKYNLRRPCEVSAGTADKKDGAMRRLFPYFILFSSVDALSEVRYTRFMPYSADRI